MAKVTEADINLFMERLRINGLAANTIKAYLSDIETFVDWAGAPGWSGSTEDMMARYVNAQRGEWSAATTKRKIACFRKFGRIVYGNSTFLSEYKVPKMGAPVPHPLPGGVDDILVMYDWARPVHHKALVVLIGLLGCRVSEARTITADDFDDASGDIVLTIRGKGDKTRHVPVDPKVMKLLDAALLAARDRPDRLLVPITDRAARRAWTRIGKRSSLTRETATHDGRMTAGTAFYDRAKDIRAVQELLGHSSVATTEGYTGISMSKLRASASVL